MDIAALSIGLSQMKLAQQASISVMKMSMDTPEAGVIDLLKLIEENDDDKGTGLLTQNKTAMQITI